MMSITGIVLGISIIPTLLLTTMNTIIALSTMLLVVALFIIVIILFTPNIIVTPIIFIITRSLVIPIPRFSITASARGQFW